MSRRLLILGATLLAMAALAKNFKARVVYAPPLSGDPEWGERIDAGSVASAGALMNNCYLASTGAFTGTSGSILADMGTIYGPGRAGDAGEYSPIGWKATGFIVVLRFLDGGTETTTPGGGSCTFTAASALRFGNPPGNTTTNGWATGGGFTGGDTLSFSLGNLQDSQINSRSYVNFRNLSDMPQGQWCGTLSNVAPGGVCNLRGIDGFQLGIWRQYTELDPLPRSPSRQ